eukprot:scaffold523_cov101-Cylindrotheca_fusiformis.AAC.6
MTPPTTVSLEARLLVLEAKLGVGTPFVSKNDIASRLNNVQNIVNAKTSAQFRETWQESQILFRELDPGMALTHQQQPLLYRRQEVLAGATNLDHDMRELSKVLHLLKPKSDDSKRQPLREDQVTQASILTNFQISPQDEKRLEDVRLTMQDLSQRIQAIVTRTDMLLESYHTIMAVASEKVVLADEIIKSKGQ